MKQIIRRWMLAGGMILLHTQTILAQQATEVDLTNENFSLEGWMFMGAGIAICLAGLLLFFLNKLFKSQALGEVQPKKTKKQKERHIPVQAQEKAKRTAEVAKQKEAERQAEIAKQKEAKRQAEMARQKEAKRQAEMARQKEAERQAEMARQKEVERQAEMTRQKEAERQAEIIKRKEVEKRKATEIPVFIELELVKATPQKTSQIIKMNLREGIILGRNSQKCEVVIEDDHAVSGVHCKFYASEGKVYVRDLGSTNGTYVNGKRIEFAAALAPADILFIGSREYRVIW